MPSEHAPALRRISLDQVCLQIRSLLTSDVDLATLFGDMIEPPAPAAVQSAITTLRSIGFSTGNVVFEKN
jgi:hypothetical protein